MEDHKTYTGLKFKEWRKPSNKNFVNAYSTSTVQALYSLTCPKHIRGKSLRIQEADAAEATAVSVGLYGTCPDIENEDLSSSIRE